MKLFMAVDFCDDMIAKAWDREDLNKFMKMNAAMGVKRICWIYHGDRTDGFWENCGGLWREHIPGTFAALGDSLLRAAVREAHAAGLEIFAIYKPFDLGLQRYPPRDAIRKGRMPVAGGALQSAFNFAVENRSALMRRRKIENIPAARIILKSAEKLSASHPFRLWKSGDNWTYHPAGEVVRPAADGHSVVFDISGRTDKFYAIESLSSDKVANRLDAIIEVKSAEGGDVQRALGLVPRKYCVGIRDYAKVFDIGGGFSREGFYFDYVPGMPSSVGSASRCLGKVFSLEENGQNVIGVSLEINDCVPGAPEPAEPRAVAYWLGMLRKILDDGVDGVDIRVLNHNSILDWAEYGFNQSVVDEYIRRYGVDPRVEPFDKQKLRLLRGEFYTAFLEKASALVRGASRKFCVHVDDVAFGPTSESTMMEMHWDWRGWLNKGILDEVTYKVIFNKNLLAAEGLELIRLCRDKAVPIAVCPYWLQIDDLAGYLGKVDELGLDAFTVYESAVVWEATPGGFRESFPEKNEMLRGMFSAGTGS